MNPLPLDRLRAVLRPFLTDPGEGDPVISGVCNDSRFVQPGSLFCAIRGLRTDGHAYLQDAAQRGAAALCISSEWTGPVPPGLSVLRVSDSYFVWGILCEEAAGRPADSLRVHTVTGTNGKTTIAFVLRHILQTAGRRTALISTVRVEPGDGSSQDSFVTMPDAAGLQKLFGRIRSCGASDAVMESSSHGLHQHRAGTLKFASGIFTNLTGDHLDYHKTMENYYQAKKLLFSSMLSKEAPAVVNTSDEWGKRLFREIGGNKLDFSAEDPRSFCFLRRFTPDERGSVLDFVLDGHPFQWHSPLRGPYNGANLLEAVTAGYALGLDLETLHHAAETAPPAPGRLDPVDLPSGGVAFVDYAHTDDALIRVLDALRNILKPGGRLIAVFGCGGDRDRTKRPRMGKAVAERADLAFITSDNPRTEDPLSIIEEIRAGIPAGSAVRIEPDRAQAIREAASLTGKDDILLVAGKGHEKYQEINGVKHPFDDRAILRSLSGL